MRSFSPCRISEVVVQEFAAVRLENELIRVDVLPDLGGRIWNLEDRRCGSQWIWHSPAVPLAAVADGSSYDDHWAGGWEELFPNDAPGAFLGRELPDHGEWWSRPWKAELETAPERVAVRLQLEGRTVPTICEKTVAVEADAAKLEVGYRITNIGDEQLHFLFKQHLALAVGPTHRLELPGGSVVPVDLAFSTRLGSAGPFEWPQARDRRGNAVDLSVLPPAAATEQEFFYVLDLPEGWCGVRDAATGARLRLHFSREVFPYTWLFMTFGGWRGLYTVVLEPCTNMPKDLSEALRQGRCASLAPGATIACFVRAEIS